MAGWSLVERAPDPRLTGYVSRYCGFAGVVAGAVRRRELPGTTIPLVIAFEGAFGLGPGLGGSLGGDGPLRAYPSFVGGLQESHVITEWAGRTHGVQVDLTPLGANLILGVPMSSLTNLLVRPGEIAAEWGDLFADRLAAAPTWSARFALLDEVLGARLAVARQPAGALTWAWRRLYRSGGTVPVRELTAETGWSNKHLIAQFRRHIGMAPKTVARMLRFERAVRLLEGGLGAAAVAHTCGYYDQAHLNRDFRQFAAVAPIEHLRLRQSEAV